MKTRKNNTTKIAVMNAAERLFATHGFEASLREITAAAKANLCSVNYHFTSKDELILAVLKRRMHPLNEERLALLGRFEEAAGGKPLAVEKILEALFRPAMEVLTQPSKGGRYFLRLLAQMLADPASYLLPLIKEEFAETAQRFQEALRRALPGLAEEDLHWRFHFAMGAFVHTVAQSRLLELSSRGKCRFSSIDDALERLVAFCAGGFKAGN